MLDNVDSIASENADLYVIAIGCNDIRYRDVATCAMTASEYIKGLNDIVERIRLHNATTEILFVSPWISLSFDPWCYVDMTKKKQIYQEYDDALKKYCTNYECGYVNPNPMIQHELRKQRWQNCLIDHIHPNAFLGVRLYSRACASYITEKDGVK